MDVLLDDDHLVPGRLQEPRNDRVEIGATGAAGAFAIGQNGARAHSLAPHPSDEAVHLTLRGAPATRPFPAMLLSALTVTRPASLPHLAASFADLAGQRGVDCELVVVHDGDAAFHVAVEEIARRCGLRATIERATAGRTLGELRNLAVSLARGELVAQWDDDDRHHPERLARQAAALAEHGAAFAFLAEQLHWFPGRGELYWEDWSTEAWPLDFVQGTLVGRRDAMPAYPPLRRGEDTALCRSIVAAGATIARVRDAGWSYVYTFHGGNAFPEFHHYASARAKHLSPARLLSRERTLRERLAEYDPPLPAVLVPCGDDPIEIAGGAGARDLPPDVRDQVDRGR